MISVIINTHKDELNIGIFWYDVEPKRNDWMGFRGSYYKSNLLFEIDERKGIIIINIDRSSSKLDTFFKIFPKSLFMHIANYINRSIEIFLNE